MAITYTWNCRTVDTYPSHTDTQDPATTQSDVVYNVHWTLLGTDTVDGVDYSSSVIGTQSVDVQDLSSFTSFDTLTNEDVTGWVTSAMGEEKVNQLKASVAASIAEKVTPTTVTKTIVDPA